MKIKTSELIGVALNMAVLMALGIADQTITLTPNAKTRRFMYVDSKGRTSTLKKAAQIFDFGHFQEDANPSGDWSQGGPIIEREKISVLYDNFIGEWKSPGLQCQRILPLQFGPTPLVAAMRCFCCSKLGDVVDIPEELCQQQNS